MKHKKPNGSVQTVVAQHRYAQTAAFTHSSSLCCFLEQVSNGVGVTPLAEPTAKTSHITGRTGCASAGFFMQIRACINPRTEYFEKQLQTDTHTQSGLHYLSCQRHPSLHITHTHSHSCMSCSDSL